MHVAHHRMRQRGKTKVHLKVLVMGGVTKDDLGECCECVV